MTMIYRCDECNNIQPSVVSGGTAPTPSGIYLSWRIENDTKKTAKHLCDSCLAAWFNTQATKYLGN